MTDDCPVHGVVQPEREQGQNRRSGPSYNPPPGCRYFTENRIEALLQFALAQPRCSIDSRTILELVCDWRNMAADLEAKGA